MPTRRLLAVLAAAVTMHAAAAAPPPNVVVILTDDQGWGDLGFHGNTNLRTPQLDSLARAGASFARFYVCPVCSPTRAEFLTGRWHPRGGVRDVTCGGERLDLDERTLGDEFKAAGYATGLFGKWHNGSQWPYHPNARGFDEFHGFTSGHWGEYFDPPLEHNGEPVRGKGYIADDLTDHALEFIGRHRERPFLCLLTLNTPHSPFCVPDEYWDRFSNHPVPLRGHDGAKENLPVTRCALAMVENIDRNVGRLLARLDELALADRTIVVFFCDNGPNSMRWNGGLKGIKGSTDEGGVRSPLLVRWPARIKPGTTVQQPAAAIDLLPTLGGLAGIPRAGTLPLDGRDLSPLMSGGEEAARAWPDRLLFSHWAGRVSARDGRFLLDHAGALFDLAADPGQRADLAAAQPEVAARMRAAVADWRRDVGLPAAPAKRRAPDPRPFTVGFPEFPRTPLPARDGVPHGKVARSAPAPNCSFFTNWTSPDDSITWDVEVHAAGLYQATLLYTCPAADAGATVALSFRGSRLAGKVAPAWDPPMLDGRDRVPRRGESPMKEFRPLDLGTMRLDPGRGPLTLRALTVPGKSVMDLRRVELRLLR